jgi:hypothetical protein
VALTVLLALGVLSANYIGRKLAAKHRDRPIAVMVPEVVERRWYQFIFRHRTTLLKGLLLLRGGRQILVVSAPWYVHGK